MPPADSACWHIPLSSFSRLDGLGKLQLAITAVQAKQAPITAVVQAAAQHLLDVPPEERGGLLQALMAGSKPSQLPVAIALLQQELQWAQVCAGCAVMLRGQRCRGA